MLRFKNNYNENTLKIIKNRSRICVPHYTNFDLLIKDKRFVINESKKMDMKNKISTALVNNQIAKRCFIMYKMMAKSLPIGKRYMFMRQHIPYHLDSYIMRYSKHGVVGIKNTNIPSSSYGLYSYYIDHYSSFFSEKSKGKDDQFIKNELFKRNKSEIKWLLNKCEDYI